MARTALLWLLLLAGGAVYADIQVLGLDNNVQLNGSSYDAACAKLSSVTWSGGYAVYNGTWAAVGYPSTPYCLNGSYSVPMADCDGPYGYYCRRAEYVNPDLGSYSGVLEVFVAPGGSGPSALSVGWITQLTPEQGARIAGAILAIWALALVFRLAIKALSSSDGETSKGD